MNQQEIDIKEIIEKSRVSLEPSKTENDLQNIILELVDWISEIKKEAKSIED